LFEIVPRKVQTAEMPSVEVTRRQQNRQQ